MKFSKMCILLSFLLLQVVLNISAVNSTCSLSKETYTCNYIPEEIHDGIFRVNIKDFMMDRNTSTIHSELFKSKNWKNVKYLKFEDSYGNWFKHISIEKMAFKKLEKLKHLAINSISHIDIDTDGLLGSENVNILEFSACERLTSDILMSALNGSEKVPNLETLLIPGLQNQYGSGLTIDSKYSKALSGKPLATVDLSMTHIAYLDPNIITDLKHLKLVNLSRATIDRTRGSIDIQRADFNRLELDLSYPTVSGGLQPYQTKTIANLNYSFVDYFGDWSLVVSTRITNLTGYNYKGQFIYYYNVKLSSGEKFKTFTNQGIFKQNKIKRFDVHFDCDNFDFSSVKYIDLSENGLEYFHPSGFSCLTSLEYLDFSMNNLNAMQNENTKLFSQLLNDTKRLQTVNLAANQLADLPDDFFESSKNLVNINLAGNGLTQVHFQLDHLKFLSFLDLSNNNIKVIDSNTMIQLGALMIDLDSDIVNVSSKTLPSSKKRHSKNRKLILTGNPFLCDTCETLSSIRWLHSTTITESSPDELTCKGESDTNISITNAVTYVQEICERKMKIIVISITSVVISIICVCVVLLIYFKRQRAQKRRRRYDIIELLAHDENQFAVFLSYSNEDVEFVMENVIKPLNNGLQRIVGIERNLICQGDTEYRLGEYVHNESLRCIELCKVVLCVVSDSYCNSKYCVEEFNQASQMRKPVILMMKGYVDIDLMTPAMQLLFRNQVRMLWENNNGDFRLKTSWKNVCESIIDIATKYQN